MGLRVDPTDAGVEFQIKVVPGASRDRVLGPWRDALRVAVSAAPEGGKANRAVIALLAEVLGVRKSAVRIISGRTTSIKRVQVVGVSVAQAYRALADVTAL